jgi:two-component system LytT family response regulator
MQLSALIVDDESRPALLLDNLLKHFCVEVKNTAIVNSAREAVKKCSQQAFDLIFLDVEMPEMDGFEFLNSLPENHRPQIVFTTAHEKYASRAFKFNALDYLLKPIAPSELIRTVQKGTAYFQKHKPQVKEVKISLYDDHQYHIIEANTIVRVEADGSYCKFVLTNGHTLHSSKRLKVYEDALPKDSFMRVHKSHMVNLNQIKSYTLSEGSQLNLINGDSIPFSISKKKALFERLGID